MTVSYTHLDVYKRQWHDTVICCYNKDRDIGGLGTSHTHGCESLMSRCIQEGDGPIVRLYGISTDMPVSYTHLDLLSDNELKIIQGTIDGILNSRENKK